MCTASSKSRKTFVGAFRKYDFISAKGAKKKQSIAYIIVKTALATCSSMLCS